MTSESDDLDALIRSMDAPPRVAGSASQSQSRERRFVRSRAWFDKPVKKIRDGRDAFAQLAHLVKTWSVHEHPETMEDAARSAAAEKFFDRDKTLSEFIRDNPRELEEALLDDTGMRRMAFTQTSGDPAGGGAVSVLNQFMAAANPMKGELLWRTMGEIDPERLTEFLILASARYAKVLIEGIELPLLRDLAPALDEKKLKKIFKHLSGSVPREKLDIAELIFRGAWEAPAASEYRLPEILPEDQKLASMKPERILKMLTDYTGGSPWNRLGVSGESIRAHAARLRELGVSRFELAEKLAAVITAVREHHRAREAELRELEKEAREHGERLAPALYDELHAGDLDEGGIWWDSSDGLKARLIPRRDHARDPFHFTDVFSLSPETGGGADLLLINTKRDISLRTNDMLPYLIRRACLFTDDAEPEAMCRLLGLI